MGDKTKRNRSRVKKRVPPTRKRTTKNDESVASQTLSSSAKKLHNNTVQHATVSSSDLGNGLVNMDVLVDFLRGLPCAMCKQGPVNITLLQLGGLAQRLQLDCQGCASVTTQDLSNPAAGGGWYNNIIIILLL